MRIFILAAILSLSATHAAERAHAGAWPREEGETFLALGGIATLEDGATSARYDPTLYAEHGVTDRLTLGIDGYAGDAETGSLFVWGRLPLPSGAGGDVRAVSAGLGTTRLSDGGHAAAGRIGLHWGRGWDDGWLALDAQAQLGTDRQARRTKAEATWGRRLTPQWSGLLQGEIGHGPDDGTQARAGGSVLRHVTPGFDIRAGLNHALAGGRDTGLTLEGWWRF